LCEAICGLKIEVDNNQIVSIKGDEQDPFSRGHICPKAVALKDIQEDPDRLKMPVKKVNGQWVETTWEDAIELACDGLFQVQQKYGANAVSVYQGNPNVHNWGLMTHSANFLGLLKTRNRFSATSVDQLPMQLLAYWMFGHQLLITIPDIDHTNYFLMLGANPIASNGSLMTVPDVAKRIKDLQARGGKLIVIDPRKTETAEVADEHHFIKPASDAAFIFALINTIVDEGLTRMDRLAQCWNNSPDCPRFCQRRKSGCLRSHGCLYPTPWHLGSVGHSIAEFCNRQPRPGGRKPGGQPRARSDCCTQQQARQLWPLAQQG